MMEKRKRILYWSATSWLALGMLSTGMVQLIGLEEEIRRMEVLGYPAFLFTFIGICKLLGTLAVLIPGYPILKEWAYAGFCFLMTGALYSHFAAGDALPEYFGSGLLLVLTLLSWYLRPDNRKSFELRTE